MKKIEILSHTHIPGGDDNGGTRTVFAGSVIEADDAVAGAVVAAGRAKYADKGAKLVDTTKAHEAEADKRASATASPEAAMAALIAAAVQAALAKPAA